MERCKSAGPCVNVAVEDIREVCRHVAPYIGHHWCPVFNDLGLEESDIEEFKSDLETTKMSEVIYRGLCKWIKVNGRAATKDNLMKVIQRNGLRRAEAELRYLTIKDEARSVRPKTAVPKRSTAVSLTVKKCPFSTAVPRPVCGKHTSRPHSSKQNMFKKDICDIKVDVDVSFYNFTNQTVPSYVYQTSSFKQKCCLKFYQLIADNFSCHVTSLRNLLNRPGLCVQGLVRKASGFQVSILCSSLGAFETFYQIFKSGRLKAVCENIFVLEKYLQGVGAEEAELSLRLDEESVDRCREFLLAKRINYRVKTFDHPTDALNSDKDLDIPCKDHQINEAEFDLRTWANEQRKDCDSIKQRLKQYAESTNEFLRTLRIASQTDVQPLKSLQDIVKLHADLQRRSSVMNGVRVDLVREYLAIVNKVRLKVEVIKEEEVNISLDQDLQESACSDFHKHLQDLDVMLDLNFVFEEDESILEHKLSVLEKEKFTGILCYIPMLMSKLDSVLASIDLREVT